MNAWYLEEVGWAARRACQERWLVDAGKLAPGTARRPGKCPLFKAVLAP